MDKDKNPFTFLGIIAILIVAFFTAIVIIIGVIAYRWLCLGECNYRAWG